MSKAQIHRVSAPTPVWVLVALLSATAAASYLCRVNLAVVGAMMMRDLHLSQVVMGRLFSAFVLGYAALQIPTGMLADRWGARRVLAGAMLGWVVITVLIALAGRNFPVRGFAYPVALLLVLRFCLGVVEAPTFPAAAQGLVRWIPPLRQGHANGVVIAGIGIGSAAAPPLLSFMMVHCGWRIAALSSAVPAFVIALAWRHTTEPAMRVSPEVSPISNGLAKRFHGSPSFALLVSSYTLNGYVGYVFVFWFYLYLVQVRHFSLMRAGEASVLPWLLSIVTIPAGGIISDRLASGSLGLKWGRRVVPIAALSGAGIFVVLGAYTTNSYIAVACLTLATGLVLSTEGPTWATLMELSEAKIGTGGGVLNMGSNLGGLVSPALTPVLAAHLGWHNALCVAAVVAWVAAALWFGISPAASSPPTALHAPHEHAVDHGITARPLES